MTAAGTIPPAKVFVIGAGVAGLQAIATARRLGAVWKPMTSAPPPASRSSSLGAKFIEVDLGGLQTEDKGGYAKELSPEALELGRQAIARAAKLADVVITTAQVPGRRAPLMVRAKTASFISIASRRCRDCLWFRSSPLCSVVRIQRFRHAVLRCALGSRMTAHANALLSAACPEPPALLPKNCASEVEHLDRIGLSTGTLTKKDPSFQPAPFPRQPPGPLRLAPPAAPTLAFPSDLRHG